MENSHTHATSLHHCHVHKLKAVLYILHSLSHFLAIVAIFYYRAIFFLDKAGFKLIPFLLWFVLFAAELLLSFIWFLKQPFYWWPVTRTVFTESLPKDEKLPGIDIFICTTDPKKEPTFEVMNTVISAMSLDYPAEKLSVYLSDDGGASVTLNGGIMLKQFVLGLILRSQRRQVRAGNSLKKDRNTLLEKYKAFKLRVQRKSVADEINDDSKRSAQDHPSNVQVIDGKVMEEDTATNPEHVVMPSLLRISATLSNSPCILVLDCDMYCNDSISARQAMCFYLDPKISPTLGWVQYPQVYHNVNKNDIYDTQMRFLWKAFWPGADGLQGPVISGTNFYVSRKALYGINIYDGNEIIKEAKNILGPSTEFIKSLRQNDMPSEIKHSELCTAPVQEVQYLASCTYEENTKWGEGAGFWYKSVVEDAMTGYMLQSKGWRSVYLNPPRPQFLGSATTNLDEYLIQFTRWISGLAEIGLSKYCPLVYSPSRMQLFHRISSSWVVLYSFDFIAVWCFVTIPLISFLYGVSLYPKVSDPFFIAFGFVFISSLVKHLCEVVDTGGSVRTWLNEQRIWKIKSLTCFGYGVADCVMAKLGLREASFIPTNKAEDSNKANLYAMGKYDFSTSNMFLVPLVSAVSLNLCCFVGGVARVIGVGNWEEMFSQGILSLYGLIISYPVLEAMFVRQDKGCIPLSATLTSSVFVVLLFIFGRFIF
uniref:Uncharacterized protein n=1 Tax=Chenopodium quinoa TaxID=63459 RepID=A0A803LMF8_CHEQI